jgi:hypothetical protein
MSQQNEEHKIPDTYNTLIVHFMYNIKNAEQRKKIVSIINSCLDDEPTNIILKHNLKDPEQYKQYKKMLKDEIHPKYQNQQQQIIYPEVFIFENSGRFGISNILSLFGEFELKKNRNELGYFSFESFIWNSKKKYYHLKIDNPS